VAEPMTNELPRIERPGTPPEQQSTIGLVRSIANDTSTLVRKEVELAKHELKAAVLSRLVGAAALGAAAVFGLLLVIFLGAAAAAALDLVFARWLSRLIVAGGFLVLAGVAALFGLRRMKRPSLAPEETKRTVKEDVEWAKAQLKR
jgi:type III secretory pathway component EscU